MVKYNEDTRVKIPAILHLCKLGYKYISLSENTWDIETNIFTDIFEKSILKINPEKSKEDMVSLLRDIKIKLDNDDLGREFYKKLTSSISGIKLIDFENFENNTFNVVTELTYKKDEDEFRPDITLLINGMPLAFVEVKIPNNRGGIQVEKERMITRFKNKKFKKFFNLLQILVFSNNQEYDDDGLQQVQGTYYGTTSLGNFSLNYFREEEMDIYFQDFSLDKEILYKVLLDNNASALNGTPEFQVNNQYNNALNKVLTSIFSKKRLGMFLEYGIAYVENKSKIQKHIMRYSQFFATKSIEKTLNMEKKKGVIWHTQGSGKTALAYYNVKYLKDYYQKKNIIAKFYFIVDRIDLMNQAINEFSCRGLKIAKVSSKEEFIKYFNSNATEKNLTGEQEITVVNIQKFKDDPDVIRNMDYNLKIQRVYFLDEVHRSYNPAGSFLKNLTGADRDAVMIGLTGTPLIGDENKTKYIFGDYIHKYFYDSSIKDGYTLKLMREGIETKYRKSLNKILEDIQITEKSFKRKELYSHPKFVDPMLDYIISDFKLSRIMYGDDTIGAMVVCDSSEQAKEMKKIFDEKYESTIKSSLILHDIGDKDERKEEVDKFKLGKIDILFVYNMLLTGFDAPRLKKIYVGRQIKEHNLLQMLTRVNRPYRNFKYGYVVDFADISKNFKKINEAYFKELQSELGDEIKNYSNLFKSEEEIEKEIEDIENILFSFNIENAELFNQQISKIEDREKLFQIKKALEKSKILYNIIQIKEHKKLVEKLDFKRMNILLSETKKHIETLNIKHALANDMDNQNLLNIALEDFLFDFKKVSTDELVVVDTLRNSLRKTREKLSENFDKKDPKWINVYEALERLFKSQKLSEMSQENIENNIKELKIIEKTATDLNNENERLREKYGRDSKLVRVHKRMISKYGVEVSEKKIYDTLNELKNDIDLSILGNSKLLANESLFTRKLERQIYEKLDEKVNIYSDSMANELTSLVTNEYINEYRG
ncbi:MAG: type I restriction endonuclease [Cetobacterium sp.]